MIKQQLTRAHYDLARLQENDEQLKEAMTNYHNLYNSRSNETLKAVESVTHVLDGVYDNFSQLDRRPKNVVRNLATINLYVQIVQKLQGNLFHVWRHLDMQAAARRC